VDKAGLSVEDVQHLLSHGIPMSEGMGVIVDGLPEGGAVLRVPYSDSLVRPGGTISGPVMMALADAAMYAAILGRLGAVIMAVTANLNIHFLHRPGKSDLIANAKILKLGKRLAVCEVALYSVGQSEMVAQVSGSYSLPPEAGSGG